ncbi:MAG: tRNA (adenosine(37)-N6)-threonylcarbamoyltransferase complex ATPase subunit type 1 TsaE, partial [Thermodesulfobacteriota bacterium]
MKKVVFSTNSPVETQAFGKRLGALLMEGDIVALVGGLGSGKTCLTQGIAQGLGVSPDSHVRSPSFIIM